MWPASQGVATPGENAALTDCSCRDPSSGAGAPRLLRALRVRSFSFAATICRAAAGDTVVNRCEIYSACGAFESAGQEHRCGAGRLRRGACEPDFRSATGNFVRRHALARAADPARAAFRYTRESLFDGRIGKSARQGTGGAHGGSARRFVGGPCGDGALPG